MSNTIEDKSEAFDRAIAGWYWLSHNYSGQTCPKYAAFCQIPVENVPSIDFDEELTKEQEEYNASHGDEEEMIKEYYSEMNETNWEEKHATLMDYLDNHWDEDE